MTIYELPSSAQTSGTHLNFISKIREVAHQPKNWWAISFLGMKKPLSGEYSEVIFIVIALVFLLPPFLYVGGD